MATQSKQPNRQSIRLRGWDYTSPGWYFATINTHHGAHRFGTIINGRMALNQIGKIIQEEWRKSGTLRANIELDEFVIMPNHVHGLVRILPGSNHRPAPKPQFGKPMIWVKPWGLAADAESAPVRRAIDAGRLLLISPFDESIAAPSARRAAWCNHYILAHCQRLVVGHLNPEGMLACILSEAPPDLEITCWSGTASGTGNEQ